MKNLTTEGSCLQQAGGVPHGVSQRKGDFRINNSVFSVVKFLMVVLVITFLKKQAKTAVFDLF